MKDVERRYEEKLQILADREGVLTYENERLNKQVAEARATYKNLEAQNKQEIISLRTQVKVMGGLTGNKIADAKGERA